MSILRVANVHFEATGSSRIDLVNDTINIVAGGSVVLSANQSEGIIVGKTNVAPAFNQANAAFNQANAAFDQANAAFDAANNVVDTGISLILEISNQSANVVNIQTFNSSGTWSKPNTGTIALIECWGGGGSGNRNTTASLAYGAGGGGYLARYVSFNDLPNTVTITVGTGGASRTGSNQNGVPGGNTSFGNYMEVAGGGVLNGDIRNGGATLNLSPFAFNTSTAQSWPRVDAYVDTDGDGVPITAYLFIFQESGGLGAGFGAPSQNTGFSTIRSGAGGGRAGSSNTQGGISTYGGNGGNGGTTATGTAGAAPGGGGGGGTSTSGAGGDGRVVVTVF